MQLRRALSTNASQPGELVGRRAIRERTPETEQETLLIGVLQSGIAIRDAAKGS